MDLDALAGGVSLAAKNAYRVPGCGKQSGVLLEDRFYAADDRWVGVVDQSDAHAQLVGGIGWRVARLK